MYLSKIELENFRLFKDFTIEFGKGFNVILGENNTGKSALFDAIRIILGPGSTGGDRLYGKKEDLHRSQGHEATSFSISLWFSGLTEEEKSWFIEGLDYNFEEPDKSTFSIHCEWSWNENKQRYKFKRWVGDREEDKKNVPEEHLQLIRWTFLGALRDASNELSPHRYSRVAKLLRALSKEKNEDKIEEIMEEANDRLKQDPEVEVIQNAENDIEENLLDSLGEELTQSTKIKTSETNFDEIVSTLRLTFLDTEQANNQADFFELDRNGLGYNNLLYIATVLAELNSLPESALGILLLEEPEAHLHPQLQTLLSRYLSEFEDYFDQKIQTLVSSHSPTVASRVNPNQINLIHEGEDSQIKSAKLSKQNIDEESLKKLIRMLDITKSSMFFAKRIILVEGISEKLILNHLAKTIGLDLDEKSISIIPVHGVDFRTLIQLYGNNSDQIETKVSVITDGDPGKVFADNSTAWLQGAVETDTSDPDRSNLYPKKDYENGFSVCDRVMNLINSIEENPMVEVFSSNVTLEFDLAVESEGNLRLMTDAWTQSYRETPRTLNHEVLDEKEDFLNRVLHFWREVCLSSNTPSKGRFAQELANKLSEDDQNFRVPDYIEKAIYYLIDER